MTTQRFPGLLCRAVRDFDAMAGYNRTHGRKMTPSERFMEVYGVPTDLIVYIERDHEKMADVIWYKGKL